MLQLANFRLTEPAKRVISCKCKTTGKYTRLGSQTAVKNTDHTAGCRSLRGAKLKLSRKAIKSGVNVK